MEKRRKAGCLAVASLTAFLGLVPATCGIVINHYRPVPAGTEPEQIEKRDIAARFVFDALHNVGYLRKGGYFPICGCGTCGECFSNNNESKLGFTRHDRGPNLTDWYYVVCEFDQSTNVLDDWKHELRKVSVIYTTTGKPAAEADTLVDSLTGYDMTKENLEEILRKVKKATETH